MLNDTIRTLQRFYGGLPMPPHDPFALFVWEVLSVRATPRKRDAAFSALKRVPALTPDAMFRAPAKKLADSVALAGSYAEQRLQALRTGADIFRRTPRLAALIRGPLTAARRAIKRLPQMNDGGAYRMLLFAADRALLPVDARVSRVARRLGYSAAHESAAKAARSIRAAISADLPDDPDAYRLAYLYLSHHAAATCTETEPHCVVCPLLAQCPEGRRRTA